MPSRHGTPRHSSLTGAQRFALLRGLTTTSPESPVDARAEQGVWTRMNKQELIGAVADTAGLSRSDSVKAVEAVFDTR